MSELKWALQNGDLEAIKEHVEKPGFDVNQEIHQGRNGLHIAADYGQLEVLQYLVSKDIDVNLPDKHGITPLLSAIFEGHTECVRYLLSKGAKKDGKAPDGSSYIECAESNDMKELLK
ncbi:myotrophin-like [Ptychodera flava]|uniref:myotrophin-like n=1 Tax=Ptychodera flava TaxID=63121 RepID=UPI00396A15FF